jgi:hypothetical protein
MASKFYAWSTSNLGRYELCPRMAKLSRLDKLCHVCFQGKLGGGYGEPVTCTNCQGPFERNDALERGDQIHEAIREYITGASDQWYEEFNAIADVLERYRALFRENRSRMRLEMELALTKEWKPTGWMARDCWVRIKIDLIYLDPELAEVVDWKSGRYKSDQEIKGEYDDALDIYAVGVCSLGLSKQTIAKLVFTDHGEEVDRPRGRVSLPVLRERQVFWENRVAPMMNDTQFLPIPGPHCKKCDFSARKGGPCEY